MNRILTLIFAVALLGDFPTAEAQTQDWRTTIIPTAEAQDQNLKEYRPKSKQELLDFFLHVAARDGANHVIITAIQQGANVNSKNPACPGSGYKIPPGLLVGMSIQIGNGDKVEINLCGFTPLHWIATSDYDYAPRFSVRALMKNGAKITAKNEDGYTPLRLASMFGNDKFIEAVAEF